MARTPGRKLCRVAVAAVDDELVVTHFEVSVAPACGASRVVAQRDQRFARGKRLPIHGELDVGSGLRLYGGHLQHTAGLHHSFDGHFVSHFQPR